MAKKSDLPDVPGDKTLSEEEFSNFIQHDPFAEDRFEPESLEAHAAAEEADDEPGEEKKTSAAPAPDGGAKVEAAETPAVEEVDEEDEAKPAVVPATPLAAAQPPVPAVAPSATPAAPSELEILRAQLQQQGQLIQELTARAQSQTPSKPPAEEEVKVPPYAFAVPDELVNALADENAAVRKGALAALIQGTAQTVHREVIKTIRAEMPDRMRSIAREEQGAQRGTSAIFDDFYGKYPHLKTNEGMAIVRIASDEVQRETGLHAWSPQLRDAIAARAQQKLLQLTGGVQPPAAAPPAAPPKAPQKSPRQPAAFVPGARPAAGKGTDVERQVADLLGL